MGFLSFFQVNHIRAFEKVMLYYLLDYLHKTYRLPGLGVVHYISFRSAVACVLALSLSILLGRKLIQFFSEKGVRDTERNLGMPFDAKKHSTPTMGGLIIIIATVVPTLLLTKLSNIYVVLLLITTLWTGLIGIIDDYIKVFKKDKKGLQGSIKVFGQVLLGTCISLILFFHRDVVVRQAHPKPVVEDRLEGSSSELQYEDVKSTKTNIPFFKKNELDYSRLLPTSWRQHAWILYACVVTFIVVSISNGANLTDGLDGLAAGSSAIVITGLAVLAYLSGNVIFAQYLNIAYIPNLGELVVFCTALGGACIGFLWYNTYPAQIFMGDTGSLMLGGVIAVLSVMIRKELLMPLLCGIFLLENLSVVLQVMYFKHTRRRTGTGRRIFLMAPLHHHFQKKGIHEAKIVARFFIVGFVLAVLTLVTLKIR